MDWITVGSVLGSRFRRRTGAVTLLAPETTLVADDAPTPAPAPATRPGTPWIPPPTDEEDQDGTSLPRAARHQGGVIRKHGERISKRPIPADEARPAATAAPGQQYRAERPGAPASPWVPPPTPEPQGGLLARLFGGISYKAQEAPLRGAGGNQFPL